MAPIVIVAKVIGTATVGVWAGYNVALANTVGDLPLLDKVLGLAPHKLALPEAKTVLERAQRSAGFAGAAFLSLVVSYFFSARNAKHPYLLYVALGAPLIGGLQYIGALDLSGQLVAQDQGLEDEHIVEHSDLSESVYESLPSKSADPQPLSLGNKVVLYARAVSVLSASLFLINLIGLAGDSAHAF